jgi:hypothetical protein
MPTFPTFTRTYTHQDYSFEVNPDVDRTQYHSGNSRQRKHFTKRDDLFNVRLILSDAELVTFEAFVTDDLDYGADTYTGPYFTSDVEYTGTLEMIEGNYNCSLVPPSSWEVTYQFELKDRDMTEEDLIYLVVEDLETISNTSAIMSALADMVNNNTL